MTQKTIILYAATDTNKENPVAELGPFPENDANAALQHFLDNAAEGSEYEEETQFLYANGQTITTTDKYTCGEVSDGPIIIIPPSDDGRSDDLRINLQGDHQSFDFRQSPPNTVRTIDVNALPCANNQINLQIESPTGNDLGSWVIRRVNNPDGTISIEFNAACSPLIEADCLLN